MSPETMPVNRGHVDGRDLIIPECCICGKEHYHGAPVPDIREAERAPHCRPGDVDGELPVEYRIVVSGGGSQ